MARSAGGIFHQIVFLTEELAALVLSCMAISTGEASSVMT